MYFRPITYLQQHLDEEGKQMTSLQAIWLAII